MPSVSGLECDSRYVPPCNECRLSGALTCDKTSGVSFPPHQPAVSSFRLAVAAGTGLCGAPAFLRGRNLNDKLNIACIGVGGRGASNLAGVASENIVALCDVSQNAVDKAAEKHPQARKFSDFRRVYEHAREFDAVVVSTCEHTHALATLAALKEGKHVYCEKPLTHNIWEARVIREAAAKTKLATQMGIQIHAGDNYRRVVELIRAQAIGAVSEVHVWVGRAWGLQSEEDAKKHQDIVFVQERPKEEQPVPKELDWDLWLGPAPKRPFNEVYVPGPKWYRWWDFGNGTMSDLGQPLERSAILGARSEGAAHDRSLRPAAAPGDRAGIDAGNLSVWCAGKYAAGEAHLASGRQQARHLGAGWHSTMEFRSALHWRQRNAALRLWQASAASREAVRRVPASGPVNPELDWTLRRMGESLQDRGTDNLQLRVFRLAYGSESSGQRGLPCGQEAGVGSGGDEVQECSGGRCVSAPAVPVGVEVEGVSTFDRDRSLSISRKASVNLVCVLRCKLRHDNPRRLATVVASLLSPFVKGDLGAL